MVPPLSRGGAEELHGPDDEVDGGDGGEDDEPEPEHDVDLLVEDVHAEHAERVEPLDGARTSVLVEDALRDKACGVVVQQDFTHEMKVMDAFLFPLQQLSKC